MTQTIDLKNKQLRTKSVEGRPCRNNDIESLNEINYNSSAQANDIKEMVKVTPGILGYKYDESVRIR